MCEEERIFSKIFNMFVWTSDYQKSLAHTDFNIMFVDKWTSANESLEYWWEWGGGTEVNSFEQVSCMAIRCYYRGSRVP